MVMAFQEMTRSLKTLAVHTKSLKASFEKMTKGIAMSDYYDRDGKTITLEEWIAMVEDDSEGLKRVALSDVNGASVSTVFLGLDHSFGFGDRPVLFETMIFDTKNGDFDNYQWRYCTEDEALAGHAKICQALIDGTDLDELDL